MPGIAGIVSLRPSAECERLARTMIAALEHEPFYQSGTCFVPELGIYAGWVAHEGSHAACQSALTPGAPVSAVMSGECLADDGEVGVASLYQSQGDDAIRGLNGLFSGLLVDRRQQRALLFNDRFGLERIYGHEAKDALYFASEAKALLRVVPELRAFDERGVEQLLAFGCTRDWKTLYRGVSLLEGGSLWVLTRGAVHRGRYFDPSEWEAQPGLDAAGFETAFQETFSAILPRYFGRRRRVGISLTGGLDTRMIMACLPHLPATPVCYTFSGRTDRTLDERIAGRVATTCGLEHRTLRIGDDFLTGYAGQVDRTVYATDGCSGATGAHEVYFNAQARQLAPVRVTGNYGSEVLRSMSTFKPLGLSASLLDPDVAHRVGVVAGTPLASGTHPVTFSAFREIPWSLFGNLAAGRSQVTFRTPYLDNDLVALAFRAPAEVRRSADPALRLIGTCDARLGRIPTDRGLVSGDSGVAHRLRRLFAEVTFKLDYLHKEALPSWLSAADPLIASLGKTGILGLHKYLPFRQWFRQELAGHVRQVLTDPHTARLPYWNRATLGSIAADHISGRRNHVREINAVLTLEAIDRLLLRPSA
jgi:asparagine synthase (glutamine-hydrolysing)